MVETQPLHPEFVALEPSWELALRADGYADNSVATFLRGFRHLVRWAAAERPGAGPDDLDQNDIRAWLGSQRDGAPSSTRSRFDSVRYFYRWAEQEDEVDDNPLEGLRGPRVNDPETPTVTVEQLASLLANCSGRDLRDRRDKAILSVFSDTGVRLRENTRLNIEDVDQAQRLLYIVGKGSSRRGPKKRVAAYGIQTAKNIDAYLRARRKVPYLEPDHGPLWVSSNSPRRLSSKGMQSMLRSRGQEADLAELHPHMLRHTWASQLRKAGIDEGSLMFLGGWSSRAMLDRYGKVEAKERALDAYRGRSVLDRLN